MKDSIDRIAVALERIAVALEKANEPVAVKQETPASWECPPSAVTYGPGRIDIDKDTLQEWPHLMEKYSQNPDIHVWTGPTAEDDNILQTVLDNAKPEDWEKAVKDYVHNDHVGLLDPFDDDKTSETCRPRFNDGGFIKGLGLRAGETPAVLIPPKDDREGESMPEFEVWTEGYRISGSESGASFHGIFEAEDFTLACIAWSKTLPQSEQGLFNPKSLTYWGCRLFNNESDARRRYG